MNFKALRCVVFEETASASSTTPSRVVTLKWKRSPRRLKEQEVDMTSILKTTQQNRSFHIYGA